MKHIFSLCWLSVLLLVAPGTGYAFSCKVNATGEVATNLEVDIYVDLTPSIGTKQNLLVDLSQQISCKNDSETSIIDTDYVKLVSGSMYSGAMENFEGTVHWNKRDYSMPITGETRDYEVKSTSYTPLPLSMSLKPIGAAGGALIQSGEKIATLYMYKISTYYGGNPRTFIWNIYANNRVVVPTGGCDVSARDVTATLPDYPGSVQIKASVHCAKAHRLEYYLTGTTVDSAATIFANTASDSPAQGIGVQLLKNRKALATNQMVSLGRVGTSPVDLGLSATYATTGERLTAGPVQSVIGVTFVYP